MKLMWLGYLVYSLGNCVMKLCIETDLMNMFVMSRFIFYIFALHLSCLQEKSQC